MTQPVQEPSEQRQIAAADYRTRQLARRPPLVPATGAEMALAYAMGGADDLVISDGYYNWQRLGGPFEPEWIEGYANPAAEVVMEGGGGQQMLTPDLDRGSILLRTGTGPLPVFQIMIRCFFFTASGWTPGHTGIRLNTDSIGLVPLDGEPELVQPSPPDPGTYPLYLSSGPLICNGPSAGATPVEFFIRVFQDSGGDLDFTDPVIVIQQIGWFNSDVGTFYPIST